MKRKERERIHKQSGKKKGFEAKWAEEVKRDDRREQQLRRVRRFCTDENTGRCQAEQRKIDSLIIFTLSQAGWWRWSWSSTERSSRTRGDDRNGTWDTEAGFSTSAGPGEGGWNETRWIFLCQTWFLSPEEAWVLNLPTSQREACWESRARNSRTHLYKNLTRTALTTSSQDADDEHTSEATDSSAPVDSDVTAEERPLTSQGEAENSPPNNEDVQEKVEKRK